jgi:hypothetical protein
MQDFNIETDQLSSDSAENSADSPNDTAGSNHCVPIDFLRSQSLFEQHMLRAIEALSRNFKQIEKKVSSLDETVNSQSKEFGFCFASLRKCQRQTAEYANSIFDRHTLWPAIRTIVKLSDEIDGLKSRAEQFKPEDDLSSNLESFKQELGISSSIATEQMAYLDIERITPVKGEAIDTGQHRVCGCVETDSKELHRRICEVTKPGIMHRKNVIEPAAVSVFLCSRNGEEVKEK